MITFHALVRKIGPLAFVPQHSRRFFLPDTILFSQNQPITTKVFCYIEEESKQEGDRKSL